MHVSAESASNDILFTTKSTMPTSTDTSAKYTEFATRVINKGTLTSVDIYYVLTEDSNLTCHIMDNDLNIIVSSDSIYTHAGAGIQTFSIPTYSYSNENMYIALESNKQSIGLGTVQEIASITSSVTANNTVSGIQNAQKWNKDGILKKVDGQTRAGISLYIKARGYIGNSTSEPNQTCNTTAPTNLFNTKWQVPTSSDASSLYAGFATRVVNIGVITSVDIYYVLSEDSNLTCKLYDLNLNPIASSESSFTKVGTGLKHFTFPNYNYSGEEIYISLESNKQSLGIGCAQDTGTCLSAVTANNTIAGKQNALKRLPNAALQPYSGTAEKSMSLYISVFGVRTDIALNKSAQAYPNVNKNVYISSSTGIDSNLSGSEKKPYKTISYAIKQNGNNTIYSLKCNDTFYLRYGLELANLENVVINSYGNGITPSICGLISFQLTNNGNNTFTSTLSEKDTGVLFINNKPFWKRKTLDTNLNENGTYYFNKQNRSLVLRYNDKIASSYFATPYTGIMISNCKNLTIQSLTVSFYGRHGIRVDNNSSNITIKDNNVHDIGGVPNADNIKYGNGIELWMNNLSNISVINNTVYNCFDAGLTAQLDSTAAYTNKNLLFDSNTVSSCRYNIEYFSASNPNTVCEIIFSNNTLKNCMDITGGYREKAGTSHGSFLCLWSSYGINDSVIVKNNQCTNSDASCIAFKTDTSGRIQVINNSFSNYKNTILNPALLYGSNNKF